MAVQYAIMRFKKYKGLEIGRIEAHDERTKESYTSNPDIDTSRSSQNFHLIEPERSYRAEAEKQIAEAGCRTRKDSVRLVETLFTASPEFFKGKKKSEIREFFQEALNFIESKQNINTIVSAVVHMDEKTPHMHLSFVPLTEDGRLSAKDIIGNRRKLTLWQYEFWEHMVSRYPELERGLSASETGRDHIPPRVFKEMTRLNKQREKLEAALAGVNMFNAKSKASEISKILEKYIPDVEKMDTLMKKYGSAFKSMKRENQALIRKNENLAQELKESKSESKVKRLKEIQLKHDYESAIALLDRIPPEILDFYTGSKTMTNKKTIYRGDDCL